MDDARDEQNIVCSRPSLQVLILVVMDDARDALVELTNVSQYFGS